MLVLVLKYISTCSYHLGVCWKEQKLGIPASWFWSIFIKFVFVVQKSKHFHYVSAQYAQWSSICCSRLKQWFSILAKRLTRFVVTLPLADWREIIQHVHIYNSVSWCLTRASTSLFIKWLWLNIASWKIQNLFVNVFLNMLGLRNSIDTRPFSGFYTLTI